jgi:two-component sensor histidine kinase
LVKAAEPPRVTIHDNAHGLPDGYEEQAHTSLGMKIATTLTRGQGGSFSLQRQHGTLATLTLPAGLLARAAAS